MTDTAQPPPTPGLHEDRRAAYAALPRSMLADLARRAPKAELHLHIEGTLQPPLMFTLAARHGVTLPWADARALRAAYEFDDLQSFLDLYYAGADVLRTEQDFFDLGWAWLQTAAAQNIVRAEMFFDPQTHTARGVPIGAVIDGLDRACVQARLRLGVDAQLILCFLRHLSADAARATLEAALPWRHRLLGVGLDSSERGSPPGRFAAVFARARALGLHLVAHAGEEGPPAYIREALDVLRVERIDHGVRCLEDPALTARLARERVPLTVCPLSNVRLKVVERLERHALPDLMDHGIVVTVNSDDPAYFGGQLVDNLLACLDALPSLDGAALYRLLHDSLAASFASPSQKAQWIAALDGVFDAAVASPAAPSLVAA